MIKIGLMGGTFDPIHFGHLVIAEEVRIRYGLEKVVFIPCGTPAHKKDYAVTPSEHRYLMTVLATVSNPSFETSRMEIDRTGPSFAIDTIREFRTRYDGEAEIVFITGADAIMEILTWHKKDALVRMCRFVAATRPGYPIEGLSKLPAEYLKQIDVVEVPGIEISSTDIRARVRDDLPIRYLTPPETEAYILKHALYRETPNP
ncbi:MAG: nicotinate-nucleotide adenylyltransferase [Armatimonadetes bacterium]|nr:nicotinate-nucleotide adenylyltransferase [Armatimonadota bacterium]